MMPAWMNAINLRDLNLLETSITPETVNEFVIHCMILWSPLQFACSRDYEEGVDFLLKNGAHPNLTDEKGWTSLHLAAYSCNSKSVKLLLKYNANLDVKNYRKRTPLCCAIESCNFEVTSLFLFYGLKSKNCVVNIPEWVIKLEEGINHCRQTAILLIGLRRFRKSPVLVSNALDIAKLLGKEVWSSRMHEQWQH